MGALSRKAEVNWKELAPALILLVPLWIGFLITRDLMWFNVELISISLLIGRERLQLGWFGISLHYLIILFCFSILFFTFPYFALFVPMVAIMGFGSIFLTCYGGKLRALGNYTFIPAVYLSCELRSEFGSLLQPAEHYAHFIGLSSIAYFSIIVLTACTGRLFTEKIKLGQPELSWLAAALAIFFATGIAAAYVLIFHIQKGEWMIWSAASVITIDIETAKRKLRQRTSGILMGIPAGLIIAYFLPQTPLMYSLAMTGVVLSLVAFKQYTLAFTARCTLIAIAASVSTLHNGFAIDRVENVLLGGVIGLLCFYCLSEMKLNRLRL